MSLCVVVLRTPSGANVKRTPETLADREFDVLVIGGGITGAWLAFDCATRGLSVALIEKGDFGEATSAKSSKLLHGGIRYLQQLDFAKVRESALERAVYQRVAPHLCDFVPFLVPTFRSLPKGRLVLRTGMGLYRLLCRGENRMIPDAAKQIPRGGLLSRAEVLRAVPIDPAGVTGGHVFYESHMENSERMTLAVVMAAASAGAVVANYLRADGFVESDRVVRGVAATDLETGTHFEIRARVTVNASGPWIGRLNDTLHGAATGKITGFSQGSHLVTRRLIERYAIAIPTRFRGANVVDRGGRHIFILPWRGYSLIGTSYVAAAGDLDRLSITGEEIEQLLGALRQILPEVSVSGADVLFAYTGIYPLQESVLRAGVYQGSGEYQLVDHAAVEGRRGLITALGAKYTTARLIAEKAADAAARQLGRAAGPCRTRELPLAGGDISDWTGFLAAKTRHYRDQFDSDAVQRLGRQYGTDMDAVLSRVRNEPAAAQRLATTRPNLVAEVVHALDTEMAVRLEDVIYRRTGMGTIGDPGPECVQRCADLMATRLAWTAERRAAEIHSVQDRFSTIIKAIAGYRP